MEQKGGVRNLKLEVRAMKKVIAKSFGMSVLFIVCYCIISLLMGDTIDLPKIVVTGIVYFLIMIVLYVIQPKLRKILGHKDFEG